MNRPTIANPPGARALYLGAGSHKRVGHTQEALVVSNAAGQTMRYPLARVNRIVSSPAVDWAGSALVLCLKHGISITWADAKGRTLGHACPAQPQHLPQADVLAMLLEEASGPALYQNWLRSRRMAVLAQWGHTSSTHISPLLWETTKRQWVYNNLISAHLPTPLQSHCHAWVVAQLLARQLPAVLCDALGHDVPLANDLTHLLWAEMNLCSGPLADHTHAERELADLFERWQAPNGAALPLHLGALLRLAKATPNL